MSQVKAAPGGTILATYTYDALDRLRTIAESGATTRFRYVGLTTAVAQIIDNTSGSVISNHATDLAGTELYDFGSGGTNPTYLGRNSHGDVTWTSGSTGAVSARAAYDPFGNLVSSSGSLPTTRWQGSYQDTVTTLYYVIARWYAPSLGSFLAEDPLTASQTDPQARDPYAYGAGDAVDQIDPSGRCSESDDYQGCEYGGYNDWSRSAVLAANSRAAAAERALTAALAAMALTMRHLADRSKSMAKYNRILAFMVAQMKAHARGRGNGGADAGSFHDCHFCDGSAASNAVLAAAGIPTIVGLLYLGPLSLINPLNVGQDLLYNNAATLATFGAMFDSYPCGKDVFHIWASTMGLRCGTWDEKYVLSRARFFKYGSQNNKRLASARNWTLIPDSPDWLISYTLWGNIDWAFTGRSWGMSEGLMEWGLKQSGSSGGISGASSNYWARQTGYDLWNRVHGRPNNLTVPILNSVIMGHLGGYRKYAQPGLIKPFNNNYAVLENQ